MLFPNFARLRKPSHSEVLRYCRWKCPLPSEEHKHRIQITARLPLTGSSVLGVAALCTDLWHTDAAPPLLCVMATSCPHLLGTPTTLWCCSITSLTYSTPMADIKLMDTQNILPATSPLGVGRRKPLLRCCHGCCA